MAQKTARVGTVPGKVNEFAFDNGNTVGDLIASAGLTAEGWQIRMNGRAASTSETVPDGALILLSKQVKGNAS